eukprot:10090836-Alexandrium_andersonii.AAC.1
MGDMLTTRSKKAPGLPGIAAVKPLSIQPHSSKEQRRCALNGASRRKQNAVSARERSLAPKGLE